MRIAVMLRHLGLERGGIGTYTRELLAALLRIDTGNEYLLLYRDPRLLGSYAQHPNVEESVLSAPSALLWDQVAVPRAARKAGIDVIFNPKLSVPVLTRARTILIMHGAEWFVFPRSFSIPYRIYHEIFARIYARRSAAIVTPSHDAARKVQDHLSLPPSKVVAIHHGLAPHFDRVTDRARLAEVRQKHHLPEQYILWVGQVYPTKNLPRILLAFAELRRRFPHKLVIVGSRSWKAERELMPIRSHGLEDDVIPTGHVPDADLPAIYSMASVLLAPSLYEGFGLCLIEAMACGCPVVTSRAGACPEVAGDAAALVDPCDVESIVDAVAVILGYPQVARMMVESGLRRAGEFSWEACARETLALFERVLAADATAGARDH
jgi:glycosyltransferase involved in cell wall biosynthesis